MKLDFFLKRSAEDGSVLHPFRVLLRCLFLGLLLFTGLRLLARYHWFCELSTAFTLVQLAVALMLAPCLWLFRMRFLTLVTLAMGIVLSAYCSPYLPLARQEATAAAESRELRVMLTNVLTGNHEYSAVVSAIKQFSPDVLAVQELDEHWLEALQPEIEAELVYRKVDPRPDNFGIGLWSRYPITWSEVRQLGDATVPSILAKLAVNGTQVGVLNLHTLPPKFRDYADTRNQQLAAIEPVLEELGSPFLVIGDLNVTMWSPFYRDMVAETGLRNCREGFSVSPTWAANVWPLPAFSPIDHILVSQEFIPLQFRRGPYVGSDHFPVQAVVSLPG